jgi:hypothetical protein
MRNRAGSPQRSQRRRKHSSLWFLCALWCIFFGGGSENPSLVPTFLIRDNLMRAGVFSRLDQTNPRSTVKLAGSYRLDSAPFPGEAMSAGK